jgi:hypothetical protein
MNLLVMEYWNNSKILKYKISISITSFDVLKELISEKLLS